LTPLTVINSNGTTTTNAQQPAPKAQQPIGSSTATGPSTSTIPVTGNLYINKTVQSIIQKYTVECKSKFDELTKIILKLNLCRKELREYDKQFKSTTSNINNLLTSNSSASASASVTRKNSTAHGLLPTDSNMNTLNTQFNRLQSQLFSLTSSSFLLSKANLPKNCCFGCASASIDNCITLFRALLCANNLATTTNNSTSNSANNSAAQSSSTINASSLLLLNYVKSELCRQGILEELIYFSLKRNNNLLNGVSILSQAQNVSNIPANTAAPASATGAASTSGTSAPQPQSAQASVTTAPTSLSQQQQLQQRRVFDHDIINLIYLLIKDNPEGSFRFQKLIMDKIEMFLSPITSIIYSNNNNDSIVSSLSQLSVNNVSQSPIKSEIMLLSSLMTKQEDSCWEMRLRLVIHILLRSLNVASVSAPLSSSSSQVNTKQRLNNPVIIESLTLPCLRILNHVCKTTTNISLLSQLAMGGGASNKNSPTTATLNKPTLPARQSLFMASPANTSNNTNNNNNVPLNVLNRFSSEPVETNYIQLQNLTQINLLNSNYLANIPKQDELDPNEFLQSNFYFTFMKFLKLNFDPKF
jgi:hypothetical protein